QLPHDPLSHRQVVLRDAQLGQPELREVHPVGVAHPDRPVPLRPGDDQLLRRGLAGGSHARTVLRQPRAGISLHAEPPGQPFRGPPLRRPSPPATLPTPNGPATRNPPSPRATPRSSSPPEADSANQLPLGSSVSTSRYAGMPPLA